MLSRPLSKCLNLVRGMLLLIFIATQREREKERGGGGNKCCGCQRTVVRVNGRWVWRVGGWSYRVTSRGESRYRVAEISWTATNEAVTQLLRGDTLVGAGDGGMVTPEIRRNVRPVYETAVLRKARYLPALFAVGTRFDTPVVTVPTLIRPAEEAVGTDGGKH